MDRSTIRRLVSAIVVSATVAGRIAAQGVPAVDPVCAETCPNPLQFPSEAAVCTARVALCSQEMQAYRNYMTQLGLGVSLQRLPQVYVDVLQPLYSGNLNDYRFGHGDRQPPHNATTDCTVTYFNDAAFVDRLRQGTLTSDFTWLFHELRHFSQCGMLGGRDRYARNWLAGLDVSLLAPATFDYKVFHDRMPMEADAKAFAGTALSRLAHNFDVNGRLVKPIALTLRTASGPLPQTLTVSEGATIEVTADVTGGSDPIRVDWSVKPPDAGMFDGAGQNRRSITVAASRLGVYEILAVASQENSPLEPARRIGRIQVAPRRQATPPPPGLPGSVQPRLTSQLTVRVRNTSGAALQATVCAGDADQPTRYGRTTADRDGRAILSILRNQTVQVIASMPGYVGVATSVAVADSDQQTSITLRPGLGGRTCQ